MSDPIIASLKQEVINHIQQNLQLKDISILQGYLSELNTIVVNIQSYKAQDEIFQNTYAHLLNQLYTGAGLEVLASIDKINSKSNQLSVQLQEQIQKLWALDHKILDTLSDNLTRTANYAIYFNSSVTGQELVYRGEVSAEQLNSTKNSLISINNNGIQISRAAAEKFFLKDQQGSYTISDSNQYQEFVKYAINAMRDALAQFQKELKGYFSVARRTHLGEQRWNRYQKLKRLVGNAQAIEDLYTNYCIGHINFNAENPEAHLTSLKGALINRGHIYEALERWLAGQKGDLDELLVSSLGNDPWYSQADVTLSQTQVKSLIQGFSWNKKQQQYQRMQHSTTVRVASMSSILQLAITLQSLLIETIGQRQSNKDIAPLVDQQLSAVSLEPQYKRLSDILVNNALGT